MAAAPICRSAPVVPVAPVAGASRPSVGAGVISTRATTRAPTATSCVRASAAALGGAVPEQVGHGTARLDGLDPLTVVAIGVDHRAAVDAIDPVQPVRPVVGHGSAVLADLAAGGVVVERVGDLAGRTDDRRQLALRALVLAVAVGAVAGEQSEILLLAL